MKIKVVRTPPVFGVFSGHVTLYFSEINPFLQSHDTYNFDYMLRQETSLTKLPSHTEINFDRADENSVIFESPVDINDFKKTIESSKFKNGQSFHGFRQNCVHAILFALEEAAQLDLNINKQSQSCKHLLWCCWGYTNIITPKELIKLLQNSDNALASESTPILKKGVKISNL